MTFISGPSLKKTVLLLSRDFALEEKIVEVLEEEAHLTHLRSAEAATRLLETTPFDVFILDQSIYAGNDNIFDHYKVALRKNPSLLLIILTERDKPSFRACPLTDGTALIMEKVNSHPHHLNFLIRLLRKRFYKTILEKDLQVNTSYQADLFHFLPANNKYFLFLPAGEVYTQAKQDSLLRSHFHHLHVRRDELLNLFDREGQERDRHSPFPFAFSEKVHQCRKQYQLFLSQFLGTLPGELPFLAKGLYQQGVEIVENLEQLIGRFESPQEALEKLPFPRWSGLTHGINCAVYALIWGKYCHLPKSKELAWAALVHNIGLSYLPRTIIDTLETDLKARERIRYEQHPHWTLKLLSNRNIPMTQTLRDMILHHHENYDGTGFPEGLKGKDLSLEASLLSLVGSYDYFRTNRPHQQALNPLRAFEELKRYHQEATPLREKFHPRLLGAIEEFFLKLKTL